MTMMQVVLVVLVALMSCRLSVANAEDVKHKFTDVVDQARQHEVRDVSAPEVTLPNLGTLRGSTTTSQKKKRTIFQYLGVPFAKAPVGELRFKAPVPFEGWSGTLNATTPGKICIQMPPYGSPNGAAGSMMGSASTADESEDCLFLNVFSPKVDSSAKLPVLVFFHGGMYGFGSARDANPTKLLDYDILLVTPQYRLGPLGFLNLQEEDVPGNAGVLDAIAALQWVQDNIEHFGGDPQKVTLSGHSAGAGLSTSVYASPMSEGLMRGVMAFSGSCLAYFGVDRKPMVAAVGIADKLKCDPQARVSCLRAATPAQLKQAFVEYGEESSKAGTGIGMAGGIPSIQMAGKKALPDTPESLLRSKSFRALPLYLGVVKHEGTFGLATLEQSRNASIDGPLVPDDILHAQLDILNVDDAAGFVADAAMGYFFDPSTLDDTAAVRYGLVDFYGSVTFKSPARMQAIYNANAGQPTFLYTFSHYAPMTREMNYGIFHGADQFYLFPMTDSMFTEDDWSLGSTMLDFVTNFVIYQNPTPSDTSLPHWEPFRRGAESYMELAVPVRMLQGFRQELTTASRDHLGKIETPVTATDHHTTVGMTSGMPKTVTVTPAPRPALTTPPTSAATGVVSSVLSTTSLSLLFALKAISW